ncbi:MAG TPA: 2'-5' RNA ligase family protein [Stenomitos sp.]
MTLLGHPSATVNPSSSNRFFIALLPPPAIQEEVNGIKQHFVEHYQSRAALRSPPHITLQPPFTWLCNDLPRLENHLSQFALSQLSVPITLQGFAAFAPRVIYIDVLQTPELLRLHQVLTTMLAEKLAILPPSRDIRSFCPHLTVAFRDLTVQNFNAAWAQFQSRSLFFEFVATHLTLLIHNGQCWTPYQTFPFLEQPSALKVGVSDA